MAIATLACVLVGFATSAFYAVLFSVQGSMNVYRHFHRGIDGAMAALFTVAGLGLIRSAFVR